MCLGNENLSIMMGMQATMRPRQKAVYGVGSLIWAQLLLSVAARGRHLETSPPHPHSAAVSGHHHHLSAHQKPKVLELVSQDASADEPLHTEAFDTHPVDSIHPDTREF